MKDKVLDDYFSPNISFTFQELEEKKKLLSKKYNNSRSSDKKRLYIKELYSIDRRLIQNDKSSK